MTKRRPRTVLWKMSSGFAVGARAALLLLITQGKGFYMTKDEIFLMGCWVDGRGRQWHPGMWTYVIRQRNQ